MRCVIVEDSLIAYTTSYFYEIPCAKFHETAEPPITAFGGAYGLWPMAYSYVILKLLTINY